MATVDVTGFTSLANKYNKIGVRQVIEDAVYKTADEAAEHIELIVDTSQTNKNWVQNSQGKTLMQAFNPSSTRTGSHNGRIDTGEMRNSVRVKDFPDSDTEVRVNVGWDDNSPDYIEYQERGFRHWITGADIAGMNAIAETKEISATRLKVETIRAIRDITR